MTLTGQSSGDGWGNGNKIPDTAEFQDIFRKLMPKLHNDTLCLHGSSYLWPSELYCNNTCYFKDYIQNLYESVILKDRLILPFVSV